MAHAYVMMNSVLDLSDNEIADIELVDLLAQMPNLKVLYLKGNPVVANIKMYRRTLISRLPVSPSFHPSCHDNHSLSLLTMMMCHYRN